MRKAVDGIKHELDIAERTYIKPRKALLCLNTNLLRF